MKTANHLFVSLAALASFLCGCSSTPVAFSPVGPNPSGNLNATDMGHLEVFSALQRRRDGNEYDIDPAWYQHTDYTVCNVQGKRVRRVFNTVAHYSEAPRLITLSAGHYLIKARAKGYLTVQVPVVVEPGRTTTVHLDANWRPPPQTPENEIVSAPAGYAVGWSAPH